MIHAAMQLAKEELAKEAFLDSMLEFLRDMDEDKKPPARECPGPVYDERCTLCKPVPGRRPIPMPPPMPPRPRTVLE